MRSTFPESISSGLILRGRFCIIERIAKGSFGQVFKAKDRKHGNEIALKAEPIHKCDTLRQERDVYKVLWETKYPIGIPRPLAYHETKELAFMAMPMLGQSLRDVWVQKGIFSIRTIALIAVQMLNRLEFIHRHGIVHLDITPDNMILGRWRNSKTVYLIGYGVAGSFRDSSGWHKTYREGVKFRSTSIFSSIHRDQCKQYSRRDDLESLMYSLIMLHNNCLPWCSGDWAYTSNHSQTIQNDKIKYRHSIFDGTPTFIRAVWKTVCTMKFATKPRYDVLRKIFLKAAEECSENDGLMLNLEQS